MYGKMSTPMPMAKSMVKPAAPAPAMKRSAIVSTAKMAGMSFTKTSGTKPYSVPMPK